MMQDVLKLKNNFAKITNVASKLVLGKLIDNPDFTLCIPVYGFRDCMTDLFDNLNSQVKSNLRIQIIVSDNKKYDNEISNKLLDFLKCQDMDNLAYFCTTETIGQYNNFNRCIELSQSNYLGMIHDDDILISNYFQAVESILPFLRKHKKIGLIHCLYDEFDEVKFKPMVVEQVGIGKISRMAITHTGYSGTGIPSCGMIFNKDISIKCGGFNDEYFASGDAFLGAVMIEHGCKIFQFYSLTGYYRIGMNTSLKTNICKAFIIQDEQFRQTWKSRNIFRKMYMKIYERFLYSQNIENKVKMFGNYNKEITIEELDYKNKYKSYKRFSLIRLLYRCTGVSIKVFNIIFLRKHIFKVVNK